MVDEAQDNEEGEHIGVYILSSTRASSEGERRGICTLYATRTPCVHATRQVHRVPVHPRGVRVHADPLFHLSK